MILQDSKENMKEMIFLINHVVDTKMNPDTFINPIYLKKLREFVIKFKSWNPEIFVDTKNGTIQSIHSNANTIVNIINRDYKQFTIENDTDLNFEEQLEEWDYMISSSLKNKTIKRIL